jgi:osmotically-inducible protein OsmY
LPNGLHGKQACRASNATHALFHDSASIVANITKNRCRLNFRMVGRAGARVGWLLARQMLKHTAEKWKAPTYGSELMRATFSTRHDDITEHARERLRQSPHAAVRAVSCEFERGVLRLRGRLSSYYLKQVAQETVAHLSGVTDVVNEVAVVAR